MRLVSERGCFEGARRRATHHQGLPQQRQQLVTIPRTPSKAQIGPIAESVAHQDASLRRPNVLDCEARGERLRFGTLERRYDVPDSN